MRSSEFVIRNLGLLAVGKVMAITWVSTRLRGEIVGNSLLAGSEGRLAKGENRLGVRGRGPRGPIGQAF